MLKKRSLRNPSKISTRNIRMCRIQCKYNRKMQTERKRERERERDRGGLCRKAIVCARVLIPVCLLVVGIGGDDASDAKTIKIRCHVALAASVCNAASEQELALSRRICPEPGKKGAASH